MPSGSGTNSSVTFNTPTLLCDSLADNSICYGGNMDGLNALVSAIKELPNLSSLKCASSGVHYPDSYLFRQVCAIGWCHALPFCCCSVDGHPLPIDELKGIKAVESIDLSGKKLGYMSAIIIGACIAGNAHLRVLKYASHPNLSAP